MKNDSAPFNPFQKACIAAYDNGDYSGMVETEDDVEGVGDTLFEFLFKDLSDREDCEGPEEALRRCDSAIRQIEEVKAALLSLAANPAEIRRIAPGMSGHAAADFINDWRERAHEEAERSAR